MTTKHNPYKHYITLSFEKKGLTNMHNGLMATVLNVAKSLLSRLPHHCPHTKPHSFFIHQHNLSKGKLTLTENWKKTSNDWILTIYKIDHISFFRTPKIEYWKPLFDPNFSIEYREP